MEELHLAIRQLDEAWCRDCLSRGPDINAVYKRSTAVTLAAEVGHWPIWCLLVDQPSFRPDAADQLGATPLYHAALHGQTEVARSLLDHGADVNKANASGVTPLSAAGYCNSYEVVDLLLRHGADVNSADARGMTPLSRAASNLSVGVVELLLRYGANANPHTVTTVTAIAPPLLETMHPDSLLPTLEKKACVVEVMKLLIEHGCDVDAVDAAGDTALHKAAIYHQLVPATLLLVSGCQLEKRNVQGRTPFHEAAARGDTEMATLLLVLGSDASAPCNGLVSDDNPNGLPLLAALFSPKYKFSLEPFLSHILVVADVSGANGRDVLSRIRCSARLNDATRETVLEAVEEARTKGLQSACVRTIRSLLGGRVARGRCLLDHIGLLPLPNSLKRLLAADADYQRENPMAACDLHLAIATRNMEKISSILQNGVDPDVFVDGQTALMAAIAHNLPQDQVFGVLDLLVKAGANVNTANAFGVTSLHIAATMGREDIVDCLLERGGDVTAQAHGETAADKAAKGLHLSLAVKLVTEMPRPAAKPPPTSGPSMLHLAAVAGDADAVGRLLELTTDADVVDEHGNSPLHVAASRGVLYAEMLTHWVVLGQISREKLRRVSAGDTNRYLEVATLLMKSGCQTDRRNVFGETPLNLAQRRKFKDMELLLIEASPSSVTCLCSVV